MVSRARKKVLPDEPKVAPPPVDRILLPKQLCRLPAYSFLEAGVLKKRHGYYNENPASEHPADRHQAALFCIGITHGGQKGLILRDQMRAVDKARLAKKLGAVSAKTLTAT